MDSLPLALITGAAHRLGKVFALTLARSGYAILLHYHRAINAAAETVEEIKALGVPVFPVQANLTEDDNLAPLLALIDSIPHPFKVLVNSASVMERSNLQTMSAMDWDATFALNLRTPFRMAQQAAIRMAEGGLIVNITDAGAHKLWTGYPAYVVSKAGLEMLTRLLAKTYAPKIRVNAIAPGLVLPSDAISAGEWEKLIDQLPLKHPVSLGDIAAALTFLLDNPSITGQTVVVDGGYSLN